MAERPTLRAMPGSIPPSALKKGQSRSDWDVHRAQVRAYNRARGRAIRLLILEHEEQFALLYRQAGAEEDPPVEPKGTRPRTAKDIHYEVAGAVAWMQGELARLQGLLDQAREMEAD